MALESEEKPPTPEAPTVERSPEAPKQPETTAELDELGSAWESFIGDEATRAKQETAGSFDSAPERIGIGPEEAAQIAVETGVAAERTQTEAGLDTAAETAKSKIAAEAKDDSEKSTVDLTYAELQRIEPLAFEPRYNPQGLDSEKQTMLDTLLNMVARDKNIEWQGRDAIVLSGIDNRDKLVALYASQIGPKYENAKVDSLRRSKKYEEDEKKAGKNLSDEEYDQRRKVQLAVDVTGKDFLDVADRITYVAETAEQPNASSAAREIYEQTADQLLPISRDLKNKNSVIVLEEGSRGNLVFGLKRTIEGLNKSGGNKEKINNVLVELNRLYGEAIENAGAGSRQEAKKKMEDFKEWQEKLGINFTQQS